MPGEIRYLIFPDHELIAAICDFDIMLSRIIQSALNVSIKIYGDTRPSIMLTTDKDRGGTSVRIEGEKILSSLILYCHKKKVPLPARGSKELAVLNGRLAILVKLSMEPSMRVMESRAPPTARAWQTRVSI